MKTQKAAKNCSSLLAKILDLIRKIKNETETGGAVRKEDSQVMVISMFLRPPFLGLFSDLVS